MHQVREAPILVVPYASHRVVQKIAGGNDEHCVRRPTGATAWHRISIRLQARHRHQCSLLVQALITYSSVRV